jgi:hypothetical protein
MSFPENGEAPQQKPNSNAGKGFQYDGNQRRLADEEACNVSSTRLEVSLRLSWNPLTISYAMVNTDNAAIELPALSYRLNCALR